MFRGSTSTLGLALATLLAVSGCASKPVVAPAECPRYVPSPEALQSPPAVPWRDLATRLVQPSSTTSSQP